MLPYQRQFIEFCMAHQVLQFGDFTLKSGRKCPYFFNAGQFQTGDALRQLGQFYAAAIMYAKLDYSILFGPAYKGIPLVASTVIALSSDYKIDKPYCFNRKEVKDHGEGGKIVGAPLQGRVLLVDDVITAGTAVRESMQLIMQAGAQLAGIVVAMDRQERGQGTGSALQEIAAAYQVPVVAIIELRQVIEYLSQLPESQSHLTAILNYQAEYGAA